MKLFVGRHVRVRYTISGVGRDAQTVDGLAISVCTPRTSLRSGAHIVIAQPDDQVDAAITSSSILTINELRPQ